MKDQILNLRALGKTYREIRAELGCSLSTIAFHCSPKARKATLARRQKLRSTDKLRGRYYNLFKHPRISPPFTYKQFLQLLEDHPRCYLTGKSINYEDMPAWSIDHVVPQSRGGATTLDNLRPVCSIANRVKTNLTLSELLEMCASINKNLSQG